MLTNGRFTRDEWNNLLHLFNNVSFLMYLVAISVIFFLTIRLQSRSPCQNEVKRRLRTKALRWRKRDHAWWRSTRRVKKTLPKVWDLWSVLVNTDSRKEVEIAAGNSMRSASRSEIGHSQASRQENVPIAAEDSMREDQLQAHSDERKHSNSNCTRRLIASTPELRNMEYTNHQ